MLFFYYIRASLLTGKYLSVFYAGTFATDLATSRVGHCNYLYHSTVVPATAGPLGERPPALAGHFCNVPTTLPC